MELLLQNEVSPIATLKSSNIRYFFVLFLFILTSSTAVANNKQQPTATNQAAINQTAINQTAINQTNVKQTINIAVGDWPPYISKEQKFNGVATHLITDIFRSIGIDTSIEFLPWTRAYNNTASGEYDATAVWMHQTDREADFIYSDAVLKEQFVFFHRQSVNFDWQTIQDLKGYHIGGGYAYSYGPEMDEAIKRGEITLSRVTNLKQNFQMLLHGRIDILPLELNVGLSALKEHLTPAEQAKITHHAKPFLLNSSFVMFPKTLENSKSRVKQFNQQLQIFKNNGRYQQYFDQFEQGFYKTVQ